VPTKWIERCFDDKVNDILLNAGTYHETFRLSETFTGPSLHFHRRALATDPANWKDKLELVYAVLASWGMHRMGASGSKMESFDVLENSVDGVRSDLDELRRTDSCDLSASAWQMLKRVFKKVRVMASGTTIVGNSKVLVHLVPNLVAPIDREYTMNFLFGSKMFQNGLEREWPLMRKIHEDFYYAVANNKTFRIKAKAWISDEEKYPWDTSILKIVDNLVIGAVRTRKNET